MRSKLLAGLGIAFGLWFIVKDPAGAADTAGAVLAGIESIGSGIGEFLTHLAT
jgi:hypothetical protein